MMTPSAGPEHVAIILAAGSSLRMGQEKARLPWLNGQNLLTWTMTQLAAAGWQPYVVVGPQTFEFWQAEFGPQTVILNPHPEQGKCTSISAGISALPPTANWLMIASVDQPRLPRLYGDLRKATRALSGKLLMPDRGGHRGHPVVLTTALASELRELQEASLGLRGWLDRHQTDTLRLPGHPAESLGWDLNTPETYQLALVYFREQLAESAKI